jgi:hypothetical protein
MHVAWLSVEWEFQLAAVRRAPAISHTVSANDQFIWLVRQPLTSVVVANPAGGKWVRTTPTRDFLAAPDAMHQFLLAGSEPFSIGGANIRGTFSIRIVGQGKVKFAVRATRDNVIQFIGAGSVESYPDGTGEAAIHYNPAFLDPADGHWGLTSIGSYHPGQTADFFYLIDQSSQTFHLSAGKGA